MSFNNFNKKDLCVKKTLSNNTCFRNVLINEPQHDKPNKWPVWPAETVVTVRSMCSQETQGFVMRIVKTLIKLGGCPGRSESSPGAYVILLILSNIIDSRHKLGSEHEQQLRQLDE